MTSAEFNLSVTSSARPPEGLSGALAALWWLAKGDWEQAHALSQDDSSAAGAWVHAHLHRVEGDEGNAGYWYARAGRIASGDALDIEFRSIVEALLAGRR